MKTLILLLVVLSGCESDIVRSFSKDPADRLHTFCVESVKFVELANNKLSQCRNDPKTSLSLRKLILPVDYVEMCEAHLVKAMADTQRTLDQLLELKTLEMAQQLTILRTANCSEL